MATLKYNNKNGNIKAKTQKGKVSGQITNYGLTEKCEDLIS